MNTLLTLGQAAQLCPGRPSTNAVWRWCRKGILSRGGQRIRLNHVRVGGKIFTDQDSLDHFFKSVAEADTEYFDRPVSSMPAKPTPAQAQRQRNIEQAERLLAEAGI
jgi:hypothetical protein